VTARDDRPTEMQPDRDREAAFEALLQGRDPGEAFGSLASFAEDVRVATGGPTPEPSAELAVLLRGRPALDSGGTRPARPLARLPGVGLRVKAALGAALATTGVAAAGAAGLLPEPVADAVRPFVELVTPFEVPAPADRHQQRTSDDRDALVEPALDQGEAPATDASASPGVTAGTQPPASSTTSPTTTAIAALGNVTATPPGTTAVAPPSSSIDGAPGAGAGSPAPETNESSHGGPPAPGTAPGRAGQPPATPRSHPPGYQGGDQAYPLGGPPGEKPGGRGVGTPAWPDDPGPPDDAGGGKPATTELHTTTRGPVGAAPGSPTPGPPAQPG